MPGSGSPLRRHSLRDLSSLWQGVEAGDLSAPTTFWRRFLVEGARKTCHDPAGVQALPNSCTGEVTPLLAPGGATATLTVDLTTPGAYEYLSTAITITLAATRPPG